MDTSGRDNEVQVGTMEEVLTRHLREFAIRDITPQRSIPGLTARRKKAKRRLAVCLADDTFKPTRRGYARAVNFMATERMWRELHGLAPVRRPGLFVFDAPVAAVGSSTAPQPEHVESEDEADSDEDAPSDGLLHAALRD